MKEIKQAKKLKKINWKFYKPYRDVLVDKKNDFLSKMFDRKKEKVNLFPDKIKKMLFMRIDGKIGDYIISSFIFREIKKKYPHIQLDVISDNSLENLLKYNKNIDNYYTFNRKKIKEWKEMIKKLKPNNYDVILDSTEGLKYKQVYFLNKMNAKVNIGYNKDNFFVYNENVKQSTTLRMKEIYCEMLKCVNIEVTDTTYDVPISSESEKKVDKFFREKNIRQSDKNERVISVNFFGASSGRKTNLENSLVILKKLRKKYPDDKIVILDSPSDREQIYETIREINDKNVLFFEDSRTILDSISLINRSDLVVSLDTSILHLGEGLNRKVMAFYGPKLNKNKWRIKEEGNILIDYTEKRINDVDFEKVFDKLNYKNM